MRHVFILLLCLLPGIPSVSLAEKSGNDKNFVIVLPININTATEKMLMQALDGIGQKKAQAIIAYREERGPFTSVEELANVKGIGPGTLDRNAGRMTVK